MEIQEAHSLLIETGLSLGEILSVKKAFSEWGRTFDPNIENDRKHNVFSNKLFPHYCFSSEKEAIFVGQLKQFAPEADNEKLLQVLSMIEKLLDIDSEYKFNSKK